MSLLAEKTLATTTYSGEKRCWTFKQCVNIHINQHTILEGLVQYKYSGIDAYSKARHLVDEIKTATLDTVKTGILSGAALCSNFDTCVSLFQAFIKQSASTNVQATQICGVNTNCDNCNMTIGN